MSNSLHDDLHALAERVKTVDVTDRAHRTARRIGLARTATGGITMAAVLAVGAATAMAAWPQSGATDPERLPAAVDPNPVVEQVTALSIVQPAAAEGPIDPRGGTFHYYLADGDPLNNELWWQEGDTDPELLMRNGTGMRVWTAISPDGTLMTTRGEGGSALSVNDPRTASLITVLADEDYSSQPCNSASWSPSSSRVYLQTGESLDAAPYRYFDVDSQKFTETATPAGCGTKVVTGADGGDVLVSLAAIESGEVVFIDPVTGNGQISPIGAALREDLGLGVTNIAGISADGTLACLATASLEEAEVNPARSSTCDLLVDLVDGTVVERFDNPGETTSVVYLSTGNQVFRTVKDGQATITRLHRQAEPLTYEQDPAWLAAEIVGFTPAS